MMEELTMLVQLAGGDPETTRRLRDAGFRRASDVARAEVHELCEQSGLSVAAARRLVRSAKEILAPAQERKAKGKRRARSGLRGVPSAMSSSGATSKCGQFSKAPPGRQPGTDQGVSKAESSALLDEAANEETMSQSFWRFG
jgi:hypothetical protein